MPDRSLLGRYEHKQLTRRCRSRGPVPIPKKWAAPIQKVGLADQRLRLTPGGLLGGAHQNAHRLHRRRNELGRSGRRHRRAAVNRKCEYQCTLSDIISVPQVRVSVYP